MTLIKSISGIRGTIGGKPGDSLSPLDVVKFCAAYGSMLLENNSKPKVVIGRDARPTGENINRIVVSTLNAMGIDVIDLGLSTTPTVEVAVTGEKADGGIILTASHNPVQWNALKLLNEKGEFISAQTGQRLLEIADSEDFKFAEWKKQGSYIQDNTWIKKHIDLILALPAVNKKAIAEKNFKIVVDAVNSSGGFAVPQLLKALGVREIIELNCEPTGHFAHDPEPLPENLDGISKILANNNYDLGIVVDPDVDRLALMCEDGNAFGEEYTLVAVSDYVLKLNKGGNTVSNLSSTRALKDVTLKAGGSYKAAAVGEVNVVIAMKENNAVIGGEGNGGIIYPELHYGRDALVGIALFLSHLATSKHSTVSALRSSYPNYVISKNKMDFTPDINLDMVLEKLSERYAGKEQNKIDGLKIEFDSEWVHLRKSNTEPILRIYAESPNSVTAEHLAKQIISDIKELLHENPE